MGQKHGPNRGQKLQTMGPKQTFKTGRITSDHGAAPKRPRCLAHSRDNPSASGKNHGNVRWFWVLNWVCLKIGVPPEEKTREIRCSFSFPQDQPRKGPTSPGSRCRGASSVGFGAQRWLRQSYLAPAPPQPASNAPRGCTRTQLPHYCKTVGFLRPMHLGVSEKWIVKGGPRKCPGEGTVAVVLMDDITRPARMSGCCNMSIFNSLRRTWGDPVFCGELRLAPPCPL